MKTIFTFFVIANILIASVIFYQANHPIKDTISPEVNPESIVLLPFSVDCIVWGNFSDQNLQQAETALNKADLPMKRPYKKVSSRPLTRHRVHTKPYENQQTVEREINKLRNMGIISYRIQEEGPLLNAISFGEFENITAAQKLLKKLNQKHSVKATISKHNIKQYQFLFFDMDSSTITQLQHLAERFSHTKLTHETCERL